MARLRKRKTGGEEPQGRRPGGRPIIELRDVTKVYPGGHMFYSRDASRAAFREDALRMYRAAIGARVGEGAGPAETR